MNKYNAKKCSSTFMHEIYHFDSQAEKRYFEKTLVPLVKSFKIDKLKLQPTYVIANAYKIDTTATKSGKSKVGEMKYTPDFEYFEGGKKVVIEVKGKVTTDYRMRLKLFLAIAYSRYGVDTFIEVFSGKTVIYDCKSVKKEME